MCFSSCAFRKLHDNIPDFIANFGDNGLTPSPPPTLFVTLIAHRSIYINTIVCNNFWFMDCGLLAPRVIIMNHTAIRFLICQVLRWFCDVCDVCALLSHRDGNLYQLFAALFCLVGC